MVLSSSGNILHGRVLLWCSREVPECLHRERKTECLFSNCFDRQTETERRHSFVHTRRDRITPVLVAGRGQRKEQGSLFVLCSSNAAFTTKRDPSLLHYTHAKKIQFSFGGQSSWNEILVSSASSLSMRSRTMFSMERQLCQSRSETK